MVTHRFRTVTHLRVSNSLGSGMLRLPGHGNA